MTAQTRQKVEEVNRLVADGLGQMQALKKVGLAYGTYYGAARKLKAKRKATKRKPTVTRVELQQPSNLGKLIVLIGSPQQINTALAGALA